MAIVATGAKTIVDLTDGKMLYATLGSNQAKVQVYDAEQAGGTYFPDWSSEEGKLVVTPALYLNQTALPLTATGLTVTFTRREGSQAEAPLADNETAAGGILTVDANKLALVEGGLLSYIARAAYLDPYTQQTIHASADITFTLLKTGVHAKLVWIMGEQVFKYDAQGVVSPAQITLMARTTNASISKWQFYDGSTWLDYPDTPENESITAQTLIVKPDHKTPEQASVFVNGVATLKVLTDTAGVEDVASIAKVWDGAAGIKGQGAYQAVIQSTGGDVFKCGAGQACLTCRVWQGGEEADPPRSLVYQETDPAGAAGDFYYQFSEGTPQVALMRFSGTGWEDVTDNPDYGHAKAYTWYRRDKDGAPMDEGGVFATGKVIYVDGEAVQVKTTFTCEVG